MRPKGLRLVSAAMRPKPLPLTSVGKIAKRVLREQYKDLIVD